MKKLIAKRIKITKKGKILKRKQGLCHNRSKKKSKFIRKIRKLSPLSLKILKEKI